MMPRSSSWRIPEIIFLLEFLIRMRAIAETNLGQHSWIRKEVKRNKTIGQLHAAQSLRRIGLNLLGGMHEF